MKMQSLRIFEQTLCSSSGKGWNGGKGEKKDTSREEMERGKEAEKKKMKTE